MGQAVISVIGSGLMGHGIAQLFASNGSEVYLYDISEKALEIAKERIIENIKVLDLSSDTLERIHFETDLKKAAGKADFVFEAILEKLPLKQEIFNQLAQFTREDTVLASNTSVIPITAIAEGAPESERHRIIGTHWWNPPHLIPLVEVIRTKYASDEILTRAYDLLKKNGKLPVHVNKDVPGFVGNRLQCALWREAESLVQRGICDAETVDIVVKNSFGLRLPVVGPLENTDYIGQDLTLDIFNVVQSDIENSQEPLDILKDKVSKGHLGAKSGQGFYEWPAGKREEVKERLDRHLVRMMKKQD